MKKNTLLTFMLCLIFAACAFAGCSGKGNGDSDQAADGDSANVDMTAETLIQNIKDKIGDIESADMNLSMKMGVNISYLGEDMSIDYAISGNVEVCDGASYANLSTTYSFDGGTETTEAESYTVVEGDAYITYTSSEGGWYKYTSDETATTETDWETELGLSGLLDSSLGYALTLEGDAYVLISDVDYSTFVEAMGEEFNLSALLSGVDLGTYRFTVTIKADKETFLPKALSMIISSSPDDAEDESSQTDGSSDGDSEDLTMEFTAYEVEMVYNAYNSIASIEVPEDVIENAEDLD